MRGINSLLLMALLTGAASGQTLPTKVEIRSFMQQVDDHWIAGHAAPGNQDWARSAYFTGHMALYEIYPLTGYLDYAFDWAEGNDWSLLSGPTTRNADRQCCGQTYTALYNLSPQPDYIADITTSVGGMVQSSQVTDWWWCDALYMAMPVFVRLGNIHGDTDYFAKMYDLYSDTKTRRGLYNTEHHLWYRDSSYLPPYTTPGGEPCFWSRGNGWVFAAHARILAELPPDDPHRTEYLDTFREMAAALIAVQRGDGFWNVSLADPLDYPGPETSGTSFFTFGLAWGIRAGLLDSETYLPAVCAAWEGLTTVAVQPNGFLGYVQQVGHEPASSQPVTVATTSDFGVGAFLLAGSAVHALANGPSTVPSLPEPLTLALPYPNPCNPLTTIRFDLPAAAVVLLRVLDLRGGLVDTLVDGYLGAGPHEVAWNGRDRQGRPVAAGSYLVSLEADGRQQVRPVAVVR